MRPWSWTRGRPPSRTSRSSRDIRARYADLDSVSVEFIDSDDFLDYGGGALIFNTAAGACFQGFVYGPPNDKGYLVNAADREPFSHQRSAISKNKKPIADR